MEVAIPLIALGGMYVISNQNEKKEAYENMGKPVNSLPNTKIPPKNYPVQSGKVSIQNPQKYSSPNAATDKYFNQSQFQETAEHAKPGEDPSMKQISSLTGNSLDPSEFKHNNMVPFFGAKIRGRGGNPNIQETILDNMQGAGNLHEIKKEIAPLFQPHQNMHYTHGAPNNSEFYMSRVNPSNRMANVKMWEEQKVAPGLNQGYGTEGSGGFNSGLAARDEWLPKTVDQLRVETNPKLTFGLDNHQGPAQSKVTNVGVMGQMEKNAPDTYYANGPDRWFTTTGLEKKQTARSIEVLQDVNRPFTTSEYYGPGTKVEGEANYIPGEYQATNRPVLDAHPVLNPHAVHQHTPTDGDYGIKGYKALPNNRHTTSHIQPNVGAVGGFAKAVIAPLMDALRPSRKENFIGNMRPNGNAGTTVEAPVIYNPIDRTKTTIREMTEGKLDAKHWNVGNQKDGGYTVSKHQPTNNQRDTTTCPYTGTSGGAATQSGARTYNAAYNQHNNVNKSYPNRPHQGGTQIFNQNENIKIDKRDADRVDNRTWIPNGGPSAIPAMETHGKINTGQRNDVQPICERINPDILTAFKQNPYTQSLNSFA